jgi:hypothetical protein
LRSLWPLPCTSDAFFRNLGLSSSLIFSFSANRSPERLAPASPSQASLVSSPALGPWPGLALTNRQQ